LRKSLTADATEADFAVHEPVHLVGKFFDIHLRRLDLCVRSVRAVVIHRSM
jgi:hypothetical protein